MVSMTISDIYPVIIICIKIISFRSILQHTEFGIHKYIIFSAETFRVIQYVVVAMELLGPHYVSNSASIRLRERELCEVSQDKGCEMGLGIPEVTQKGLQTGVSENHQRDVQTK